MKSPSNQAFDRSDPEENKPGGTTTSTTCKDLPVTFGVANKVQVKVLPSTDNHDTKANEDDLNFLELKDFLSVSWQISCVTVRKSAVRVLFLN